MRRNEADPREAGLPGKTVGDQGAAFLNRNKPC